MNIQKFNSPEERDLYIRDMQNLAIATIDGLDKESKKELRVLRRKAKELGLPVGDETALKYWYVNERKIALLSYIAVFPEYVDNTVVKRLANIGIEKYQPMDMSGDAYTDFGKDKIFFKEFGKHKVMNNIAPRVFIHEMIHNTSVWNSNREDFINMPYMERERNILFEEGITENKTNRVTQSVEYRELCKKYGVQELHTKAYPMEQVVTGVLDILLDGRLFDAHCKDLHSFNEVMNEIWEKYPEIKVASESISLGIFSSIIGGRKAINGYDIFYRTIILDLLQKQVTKDNVLQFAYLANCASEVLDLVKDNKLKTSPECDKRMLGMVKTMQGKVAKFEFDTTQVDNAMAKCAKSVGETPEQKREFLDWLDSTGLTRTDLYSQFLYQKIYYEIISDNNLKLYYDEASNGKLLGSTSLGDIWHKALRIAENREDFEHKKMIKHFIESNPNIKDSISQKEKDKDKITGRNLPKNKLFEIVEQNMDNDVFLSMSSQEKRDYLIKMYSEDTSLVKFIRNASDTFFDDIEKRNDVDADSDITSVNH